MRIFKYILLSLAVLFAANDFCFAQTYSVTPDDTVQMSGYMEDLQTLTISQLNTTADTIFLKWQKVSATVPSNWEASICDTKVCYTTLVDSGLMNPTIPTESGFLLLHITAHVNYGTAIIRYAVWDIANPSLKDTVTFIMTVAEPSAIVDLPGADVFTCFPNPANNQLTVLGATTKEYGLALYNSIGQKVYSSSLVAVEEMALDNLPSGLYNISISENSKSVATRKIIIQH